MVDKLILFKSDFANFKQCPKRVWLSKYSITESFDTINPFLAEFGNIVGNRAKDWAKQFVELEGDKSSHEFSRNSSKSAVEDTSKHIISGTQLLFESAFLHHEVYCRTDILWNKNGKQIVSEVKSSTSIKNKDDAVKKYGLDLAIQLYAMQSSIQVGIINLEGFHLVFPDKENSTVGFEGLNFKRIDLLDSVVDMQSQVSIMAEEIQSLLSEPYEPEIKMGKHCKHNGGCPFIEECRQDKKELLAFELPGFNGNWRRIPELKKPLYPQEMQTPVKDIDEGLLTLPLFRRIKAAEISQTPSFDKTQAIKALENLAAPFGYIDFEFASSFPFIPAEGMQLGQRIPFQYVVYERDTLDSQFKEPKHFLNLHNLDPRRAFAESLIRDCKGLMTIFVYNKGAEGAVIQDLINAYPDISGKLNKIQNNLFDLLPVVRDVYYHPDMLGSYSLKSVLPTIGVSYEGLGIQGGNDAQLQYLFAMHNPEKLSVSLSETEDNLKQYCGLDTLGMVYLHDFLLSGNVTVMSDKKNTSDTKRMKDKSLGLSMHSDTQRKPTETPSRFITRWQMVGLIATIIFVWAIFSPIIYQLFGPPPERW